MSVRIPTTVVAIDFGTAATGYCIAQAPPVGSPITSARVFPFKPGDRSSAATEKNLTAVLLENNESLRVLAFGREARRRFFDLEEDQQKGVLYLEQFKMVMAPSRRGKVPLSQRSVHALGADIAIPLVVAIGKVLEAVAKEAIDRLRSLSVNPSEVGWVITVPAIWDDQAKSITREAAVLAGINGNEGSPPLLLCLEPEGAIVASMVDASAEIQSGMAIGSGVMILDCGGGTVDVTVSEVVGVEPYSLKEVLPASGDAWGGTIVDSKARKFFNDLLCPAGTELTESKMDPSSLNQIMDSWESAKASWDPEDPSRAIVKVDGLASVCSALGGPEVVVEKVNAFNTLNNFTGQDAVVYKPRSFALWLPSQLVKSFFDSCVNSITEHVLKLFVEADNLGNSIQYVFLVGGFAESVYLQRAVRSTLSIHDDNGNVIQEIAKLVVPNKPVQVVNRGSALWGLYPTHFITSRISKSTYAVELIEPYDPVLHDPLPSQSYLMTNGAGVFCKHVLVPLVQRGDIVSLDGAVKQEALPISVNQRNITFSLYRLNCRLPPMNHYVKRALVIEQGLIDPPVSSRMIVNKPTPYVGGGGGGGGGAGARSGFLGSISSSFNSIGVGTPARKKKKKTTSSSSSQVLLAPGANNDQSEEYGDLSFEYPDILPVIRSNDIIASISVEVEPPLPGQPLLPSTVSLFFGKTELLAVGRSSSGKETKVKLSFQSQ
jgi:hypothetical protein